MSDVKETVQAVKVLSYREAQFKKADKDQVQEDIINDRCRRGVKNLHAAIARQKDAINKMNTQDIELEAKLADLAKEIEVLRNADKYQIEPIMAKRNEARLIRAEREVLEENCIIAIQDLNYMEDELTRFNDIPRSSSLSDRLKAKI